MASAPLGARDQVASLVDVRTSMPAPCAGLLCDPHPQEAAMAAEQFEKLAFEFGWTEAISDAASSKGPEHGVSEEAGACKHAHLQHSLRP